MMPFGFDQHYAYLEDRSILWVQGNDAASFLQRFLSNDIRHINENLTIYGLLLTPQGKFLYDLFLLKHPDSGFLVDCYRPLQDALIRHLLLYKLRANITITAKAEYHVYALKSRHFTSLGLGETKHIPEGYVFGDPRHAAMGQRAILTQNVLSQAYDLSACSHELYHAQRIELTLPQGHDDLISGASYPHDFNLDSFHAIDYQKGCYVGQEVTARMHYKAKLQKAPYTVKAIDNTPLPPHGTALVKDSGETVGTMCSSVKTRGLAVIKKEAETSHLYAGNVAIAIA